MPTIRNLHDLEREIGAPNIGKQLFKATECGITFSEDPDGIVLGGYAEGADDECPPHRLAYPFTAEVFWSAVKLADEEGCAMWHEWNDDDAVDALGVSRHK